MKINVQMEGEPKDCALFFRLIAATFDNVGDFRNDAELNLTPGVSVNINPNFTDFPSGEDAREDPFEGLKGKALTNALIYVRAFMLAIKDSPRKTVPELKVELEPYGIKEGSIRKGKKIAVEGGYVDALGETRDKHFEITEHGQAFLESDRGRAEYNTLFGAGPSSSLTEPNAPLANDKPKAGMIPKNAAKARAAIEAAGASFIPQDDWPDLPALGENDPQPSPEVIQTFLHLLMKKTDVETCMEAFSVFGAAKISDLAEDQRRSFLLEILQRLSPAEPPGKDDFIPSGGMFA